MPDSSVAFGTHTPPNVYSIKTVDGSLVVSFFVGCLQLAAVDVAIDECYRFG